MRGIVWNGLPGAELAGDGAPEVCVGEAPVRLESLRVLLTEILTDVRRKIVITDRRAWVQKCPSESEREEQLRVVRRVGAIVGLVATAVTLAACGSSGKG